MISDEKIYFLHDISDEYKSRIQNEKIKTYTATIDKAIKGIWAHQSFAVDGVHLILDHGFPPVFHYSNQKDISDLMNDLGAAEIKDLPGKKVTVYVYDIMHFLGLSKAKE